MGKGKRSPKVKRVVGQGGQGTKGARGEEGEKVASRPRGKGG